MTSLKRRSEINPGFYGLKLDTEMLTMTGDLNIHIARPQATSTDDAISPG